MLMGDRTKVLIAETLRSMIDADGIPIGTVRVTSLCKKAGINAQVFYYHFKDKYDVAAWMFLQDFRRAFDYDAKPPKTREDLEEMMTVQFESIWDKREAYRNLLDDSSQNSLREYVHEYDVADSLAAFQRSRGDVCLDGRLEYLARYASHGGIGTTIEWLQGRIKATPEQMAHYQLITMPPELVDAHLQSE